jgi:hypothetical protein
MKNTDKAETLFFLAFLPDSGNPFSKKDLDQRFPSFTHKEHNNA